MNLQRIVSQAKQWFRGRPLVPVDLTEDPWQAVPARPVAPMVGQARTEALTAAAEEREWQAVIAAAEEREWQAVIAAAEEREWQVVIARARATAAEPVVVAPPPLPPPTVAAPAPKRPAARALDRDRAWQVVFGKARPGSRAAVAS
jgi:hypothetical protein